MKTVLILRHAKSDWASGGQADFDRPLAKRGLEDAPRMGDMLIRFACLPDRILSSPAQRAKQTAELVAKACDYRKAIEWLDSFYEGGSEDLVAALQELPPTTERVLLVGHNPTMEDTVTALCATEGNDWAIKIPTAGLVCLNFDIATWANLEPGRGVLQWFVTPKLVKAIQKDVEK